jgi:putative flippase GtrA
LQSLHITTALKFLAVGSANTLFGLSVIFVAKKYFGLSDVFANFSGYACGIILSFALNKRWTFKDRSGTYAALKRFLMVTAVAYLSNIFLVLILIKNSIPDYIAHPVGAAPYIAICWIGYRFYAFQNTNLR